jgi:SAGA-associated factor 29
MSEFFPYNENQVYPSTVTADFKRIKQSTLKRYIRFHDVNVREGATPDQLAVAVARHFDARLDTPEEQPTIKLFCDFVQGLAGQDGSGGDDSGSDSDGDAAAAGGGGSNSSASNAARSSEHASAGSHSNANAGTSANNSKKRKRAAKEVAAGQCKPGAEVAAKVKETWIHARVVRYHQRNKRYEVEDADTETGGEKTDRYQVTPKHVIPLVVPKQAEVFEKGARVLALFPWTTSFYAGTIVNNKEPGDKYGVRFDDDMDDGKIVKKRKIPRYFVVRHPARG